MVIWGILSKFVGSSGGAGHSPLGHAMWSTYQLTQPSTTSVGTYNVYIFNTCLDSQWIIMPVVVSTDELTRQDNNNIKSHNEWLSTANYLQPSWLWLWWRCGFVVGLLLEATSAPIPNRHLFLSILLHPVWGWQAVVIRFRDQFCTRNRVIAW